MSDLIGVSGEVADPGRELPDRLEWNPGRRVLKAIRDYQRLQGRRGPFSFLRRGLTVIRHRIWSAIAGTDIPLNAQIGLGLLIPHPQGIVIHPKSQIGVNCLIFQQVTIGTGGHGDGVPILGDHVDVGAGAKVLGDIRIGHRARIGANAVVTHDVPADATVVGIPARVVSPQQPNSPPSAVHELGGCD